MHTYMYSVHVHMLSYTPLHVLTHLHINTPLHFLPGGDGTCTVEGQFSMIETFSVHDDTECSHITVTGS